MVKKFKKSINSYKSNENKYKSAREELPIYKKREQLLKAIKSNSITIIVSDTGSGKSTQIPQYLMEDNFVTSKSKVLITQPRRVACTSLAERVSQEAGCGRVGLQVGYSVRFDDKTSKQTIIKYATDGMILRELIEDPNLEQCRVLILDEAHERTLRNDILLAHAKTILEERNKTNNPFHIVVMSATLDANNAPIIEVPGRNHPVAILNSQQVIVDYIDSAVQCVLQIHLLESRPKKGQASDILVFLPGQEEIEACQSLIIKHLKEKQLETGFPELFAGLPAQQQSQALKPINEDNVRKCILSTNVAETSLTIRNIKFIIDTGVAKYRSFKPNTGMEYLQVQPISQSSARQRAGRAGREGPGICYRLYPYKQYLQLEKADVPEILRCNLDSAILTLLASRDSVDLFQFPFLDPPSKPALEASVTNLYALQALRFPQFELTPLGKQMAQFPLDPKYSRALLASQDLNCVSEVLTIIAALSSENLFYAPNDKREEAMEARQRFVNPKSDHLTYLSVINAFCKEVLNPESELGKQWCSQYFVSFRSITTALDILNQLKHLCRLSKLDYESSSKDEEKILKALLHGSFLNAALLMPDGKYRTVESNQLVKIHPSSVTVNQPKVEAVMFNEIVTTTHPYLRGVSVIDRFWLSNVAPHVLSNLAHETV